MSGVRLLYGLAIANLAFLFADVAYNVLTGLLGMVASPR
jgi:hypothetical protein